MLENLMDRAMEKRNTMYLSLPMYQLVVIDEQKDGRMSAVAKENDNRNDYEIHCWS